MHFADSYRDWQVLFVMIHYFEHQWQSWCKCPTQKPHNKKRETDDLTWWKGEQVLGNTKNHKIKSNLACNAQQISEHWLKDPCITVQHHQEHGCAVNTRWSTLVLTPSTSFNHGIDHWTLPLDQELFCCDCWIVWFDFVPHLPTQLVYCFS